MPKQCLKEGCSNNVFSGGFCSWHQWMRKDKIFKPLKKTEIKKSTTPIPKESKKRKQQKKEYNPIRDNYLSNNPICEVHDCNNPSNQVHHKKGRDHNTFEDQWALDNQISLLCDARFFMACCGECHPKRIHENPEWSYKHGYMISK